MTEGTCSIVENGEPCGRVVYARSWCGKHYARWRIHGDPTFTKIPNYGTGRILKEGYVLVWRPGHPLANAVGYVREHRLVMYEAGLLVDESMEVHHRDGDKQNNALDNLEAMTKGEHSRQHAAEGIAGMQSAKTHCPQGHPYDEENTYVNPQGRRVCRTCTRAAGRAWAAHKRAAR